MTYVHEGTTNCYNNKLPMNYCAQELQFIAMN
jgi:hypothetical protein